MAERFQHNEFSGTYHDAGAGTDASWQATYSIRCYVALIDGRLNSISVGFLKFEDSFLSESDVAYLFVTGSHRSPELMRAMRNFFHIFGGSGLHPDDVGNNLPVLNAQNA
jgi:hypothetical protein